MQALPVLLGSFDRYVSTVLSGNKINGHFSSSLLSVCGSSLCFLNMYFISCVLPRTKILTVRLEEENLKLRCTGESSLPSLAISFSAIPAETIICQILSFFGTLFLNPQVSFSQVTIFASSQLI